MINSEDERIAKLIDIAIWRSETRILNTVKTAILANNKRIEEQLIEMGVISPE